MVERVVEPTIVGTWSFFSSVFNRDDVEAYAADKYPGAELEFRSWLSWDFVVNPQSPEPAIAGIRTALLGSLWVVLITLFFSFPIGVGAAIYLEEYARENRLTAILQTNINNLAGVPSIIYGMLGLAIFVRTLEAITSGSFLGTGGEATANGRTIVSAGLTLGLLILPIIIINAQEAIRAVPSSLRHAGMALGSTRWQTVRATCCRMPCLASSRAPSWRSPERSGKPPPGRRGRIDFHHHRSGRTVLEVHGVADPDLPVDEPTSG